MERNAQTGKEEKSLPGSSGLRAERPRPAGLMRELMLTEDPAKALEDAAPFVELMSRYRCAMMEVETKLRVLDEEFSLAYNRNPFETIKTRLKRPVSIIEKMRRKGYELSVESIERNLNDIAGIRVICSFPDDIYTLADLLAGQDDIRLLEKKDYIAHPKPNGYRSLHLILEVPIFLSQCKKYMKVEVQFRTIAMDFWASLEHKLKYKRDIRESEEIAAQLAECAEIISSMDVKMQEIRNRIEAGDNGGDDRNEEKQKGKAGIVSAAGSAVRSCLSSDGGDSSL